MPRIRTIKPEFFSHEELSLKSPHARLLAIGLLTLADCEGRLRWVPMQVHAQVFPWEASVNIEVLLGELIDASYVVHYSVEGKRYVQVVNFLKHQRLSGKEAKYKSKLPGPEQEVEKDGDFDGKNGGNTGEATGFSPGSGGAPLGTGEQGNRGTGEVGTGEQGNDEDSSELEEPAREPASATSDRSPLFPCSGRKHDPSEWQASDEQIDGWSDAYPAVDVVAELRRAKAWLDSNPNKRKTARGMPAFLNRWMSRQQDQGGTIASASPRAGPKTFAQQRIENSKAAIEEFANHEGF